jgi:hypothetical protein
VAWIALCGLFLNEQVLWLFRVVRRMAVKATDIIAGVGWTGEMPLLEVLGVASQASGTGFLAWEGLETDDLAGIASAFHVFWCRAVAWLAAVAVAQCSFEMRRVFEALLINFLMARPAGFWSQVVRGLRSRLRPIILRLGWFCRFLLRIGVRHRLEQDDLLPCSRWRHLLAFCRHKCQSLVLIDQ